MQWIQDPSQSNVDIMNNVRREVRHFRNKKKAYLRGDCIGASVTGGKETTGET